MCVCVYICVYMHMYKTDIFRITTDGLVRNHNNINMKTQKLTKSHEQSHPQQII